MFQLLHPIWLFSLAGIAIPLIIHLWNIREGKTLQVGSILLLQQSARQQARSLRLKNILLLILRCLLVIILAFLLAKPAWNKPLNAPDEKGWILIEKQGLGNAYKTYRKYIDSLLKAGYTFHYYSKGFESQNLRDALKKNASDKTESLPPYWITLRQLNEVVPPYLPVYLFTDNRLQRFAGARPRVSMNLKWNTYTPGDTTSKLIVKAYKTATDSIHVIVANSKPVATFYTFENILNNTLYRSIDKGKLSALRDSTISNSVEPDTSSLHISIYADQFFTDANYLKAAINAIEGYTGLTIKVSIINNIRDIKTSDDWVFWLSDKTMALPKLPAHTFVYEKGKEQQIDSWITTVNNLSVNEEDIHVSRVIENNEAASDKVEPVWEDGFGRQVLSLEKAKNIYRFYSRFNPEWNDLPWSTQFAEMIFDLLVKPGTNTTNFDNRIISASQLRPVVTSENKAFYKQRLVEKNDLGRLFWIIAFLIFSIERYISLTGKRPGSYA